MIALKVLKGAENTANNNMQVIIDKFISMSQVNLKTQKSYITYLKHFTNFLNVNNIEYTCINEQTLIDYKQSLNSFKSVASRNTYLTVIKKFVKYLEIEDIINLKDKNLEYIKLNRIEKGYRKDYINTDDITNLLNNIDNLRDKAIVYLMVTSGIRCIELCRLDIKDYRNGGIYTQGKGHSEKDHFIKLNKICIDLINKYLETRNILDDAEPLFISNNKVNNKGRIIPTYLSRVINKYLKKANIKTDRVTAHSLRHSFATNAIRNGATIQDVQYTLGHKNINTTMIYAHIVDAERNNSTDYASQGVVINF